jgi:hypothetical protein
MLHQPQLLELIIKYLEPHVNEVKSVIETDRVKNSEDPTDYFGKLDQSLLTIRACQEEQSVRTFKIKSDIERLRNADHKILNAFVLMELNKYIISITGPSDQLYITETKSSTCEAIVQKFKSITGIKCSNHIFSNIRKKLFCSIPRTNENFVFDYKNLVSILDNAYKSKLTEDTLEINIKFIDWFFGNE